MRRSHHRSAARFTSGALLALGAALTAGVAVPTAAVAAPETTAAAHGGHARTCREVPATPGTAHDPQGIDHWNNTGSEKPLPICL